MAYLRRGPLAQRPEYVRPNLASSQINGLLHWWTGSSPRYGYVEDHIGGKPLIRSDVNGGGNTYPDKYRRWPFGGGNALMHGDDGLVFPEARVQGDGLIANTDAFTLAVWYQNDSASTGISRTLFARGRDGFGDGWSINLRQNSTTSRITANVVTTSAGAAAFGGEAAYDPADRYAPLHLVMRWRPGVGLDLFINGVLAGEWATTTTGLRGSTWGTGITHIGSPGGGDGFTASGYYPDTRLYNRPLSDGEIARLYDPRSRWELYGQAPRRVFVQRATTATARPSGTVTAGTWTAVGAASLHAATNDAGDSTYIQSSAGAASDLTELSFPAMGTPGAGTVTFYVRHRTP